MKTEVCFYCNRVLDKDGEPGDVVELTTQISLLLQRHLKSTICYPCFRERYKTLRRELASYVQNLKDKLGTD